MSWALMTSYLDARSTRPIDQEKKKKKKKRKEKKKRAENEGEQREEKFILAVVSDTKSTRCLS